MQNTPVSNPFRFTVLAGIILTAAAFRILPHPHNFSPIAALALFGGAQFADKRAAFLVPLAAMFLGDLVLGLHALIPVIYGCFALIVCLGFWLRKQKSAGRIAVAALAGSMLFFALTNFAVWAGTSLYPKTGAGLAECYLAAIPFFKNTLTGDLFYTTVLFGGLALAEWRLPRLREVRPA
jgi:hypothetical protein